MIGSSGRPVDRRADQYRVGFDWFGTAGIRDFNYLETLELDRGLAASKMAHRVEIFEGGHRWPPPEQLKRGVEWLEVRAMKRGLRERDDAIVKSLHDADLAAARTDADPISRVRRYETIVRTFDGLVNVEDSRTRAAELRGSSQFARAAEEERGAERLEQSSVQKMFAVISSFVRSEDIPMAPALAHDLQINRFRKMAGGRGYEAAAAQRVLESTYVQLDFYVARQLSGQKLTVVKQVAELIHPAPR